MVEEERTVVVVADRDEDCTAVLASLRASAHFIVHGPVGAFGALQACATFTPVAVMVHVHLKDLTAEELCALLRGRARTTDTALLLFTPHSSARVPTSPPDSVDRLLGPTECGKANQHLSSVLAHHSTGSSRARLLRTFAGRAVRADFERSVVVVADRTIDLRPRELRLLQLLVSEAGRTLSRAVILRLAWDERCDGRSRTIDVHVRRLREKLGPAGAQIETVVGLGYRFIERAGVLAGLLLASCAGTQA